MFRKVLIVEDHESISISVRKTLADIGISNAEYTYYCDDAMMLITKSLANGDAYDLLISDLYFEEDHRPQKITDGIALTSLVKQLQPDMKIIIFSAETRVAIIESLFKNYGIDGYVRKARHDAKELKLAIDALAKNKTYISSDLRESLRQKNSHEFTDFDTTIITQLAQGTLQKDIPIYLMQNNIKPSGLSSVEKRLNFIKETLGFSKNEQLVAYCKDFGII